MTTPYDRCRTILAMLQVKYPTVGLTFGYIGNCERWGDDRSWRFFTGVRVPGSYSPYQRWQFGYCSTDQLGELADRAESELEHWITTKVLPCVK